MQRPDLVLAGLVVMATIAAVAVAASVLMKHWAEFSRLQRIRIILGISVYLGFVGIGPERAEGIVDRVR